MKIKKKRNLALDEFIDFALYSKKFGYYIKKNPFGEKGDFVTSPNISRLFSEMTAVWIIKFWESLGSPKNINVKENLLRRYPYIEIADVEMKPRSTISSEFEYLCSKSYGRISYPAFNSRLLCVTLYIMLLYI